LGEMGIRHKTYLKEIGVEHAVWTKLAFDRDQWRDLVNMVMK